MDFWNDMMLEFGGNGTQGLEDLIVTFFQWIINFDVRLINVEYISQLLTTFSPIWNPIWKAISEYLTANFGF